MIPNSNKPILVLSSFNKHDRQGLRYFRIGRIILLIFGILLLFSVVALFLFNTKFSNNIFLAIFQVFIFFILILILTIFFQFIYIVLFNYLYNKKSDQNCDFNHFRNKLSSYRLIWGSVMSSLLIFASYMLPQQITFFCAIILILWGIIDTILGGYASYKQDKVTEFYEENGKLSVYSFEKYPYYGLSYSQKWFWSLNNTGELELSIFFIANDSKQRQKIRAKSLSIEEFENFGKLMQNQLEEKAFILSFYTKNLPIKYYTKNSSIKSLVFYPIIDRIDYNTLHNIITVLQNNGRIKITKDNDIVIKRKNFDKEIKFVNS